MTNNLDDVWPLQRIFERNVEFFQQHKVTMRHMEGWASKRKSNGFPEPVRFLGRYAFYNEGDVIEWATLWTRVNRTGNPDAMETGRKKAHMKNRAANG